MEGLFIVGLQLMETFAPKSGQYSGGVLTCPSTSHLSLPASCVGPSGRPVQGQSPGKQGSLPHLQGKPGMCLPCDMSSACHGVLQVHAMVRQELVTQLVNRILTNASTFAGHYIGKSLRPLSVPPPPPLSASPAPIPLLLSCYRAAVSVGGALPSVCPRVPAQTERGLQLSASPPSPACPGHATCCLCE